MSWLEENYEKAALGGAAAILVGVVATSVLGGGSKTSPRALSFERVDEPDTALLGEIAAVLENREHVAVIRPKVQDGREVSLFVGQKLYMAEGKSDPIDLYESPAVHEGIANEWWRKYQIDPSFANAPDRDFDKDGFTNREEYVGQTNPADSTSYPSPLVKLAGVEAKVFKMQFRWSLFDQKSVTIYYQDNQRARFNERVQIGGKFFENKNPAVHNRFVLGKEIVKREDSRGREQDAYLITDTEPLYKGTDREQSVLLRRGPHNGGFSELQDRSVVLTLNALGEGGETFTVREFESFSLPYNASAKKRPYRVVSITPVEGNKGLYTAEIEYSSKGESEKVTLTVRKK